MLRGGRRQKHGDMSAGAARVVLQVLPDMLLQNKNREVIFIPLPW